MRNIGFGLERIGLAALRWPLWFGATIALITIVSAFSISQLRFDDDVIYAFRSNSETFQQFSQLLHDRNGVSNDVVMLVESEQPFDAAAMKQLREMHFELEFANGVASVLSAFALRETSSDGEAGPAFLPDEFDDTSLPGILDRIEGYPLAFNRAISPDRTAMMFVISDAVEDRGSGSLRGFIEALDGIADQFSQGGVSVSVLGMQKTRFEIADAILRDQIIFNAGGSLVSILIAFLVFGSIRMTLLVLSSGSAALIWTLGAGSLAGQPITVVTNIIPVLIIVISFTNSMHLVHGLREHQYRDGESPIEAIADTIRRIGPACALTSLTTAAAFASLSLTGYGALAELAWFGAAAALISFLAIISVFPIAARFLVRSTDIGTYHRSPGISGTILQTLSAIIAPGRLAVIGIALVLLAAGAFAHINTTPRFSTYDNVPRGNPVLEASLRAEDKFGGLFNLWIRIPGEPNEMMTSKEGWQQISSVHDAVEEVLGKNSVFSPLSIARVQGSPDQPLGSEIVDKFPEEVTSRIGEPGSGFLTMSALVGDPARSDQHTKLYDAIDTAARSAGATIVTGTPALARHDAQRMILRLNASIIAAAVATIFLVALAFRSVSLIPALALANLTPVLLTGLILHLFAGGEIKIATGLAMTIAFGVAVDDTIHFVNRAYLERDAGRDVVASVAASIKGVGYVLCATTIVLGAGISLTFFSNFYTVRLFGQLLIMILCFALLADLLILPAVMLTYRRWHQRRTAS